VEGISSDGSDGTVVSCMIDTESWGNIDGLFTLFVDSQNGTLLGTNQVFIGLGH
jgi:hypothetical protein